MNGHWKRLCAVDVSLCGKLFTHDIENCIDLKPDRLNCSNGCSVALNSKLSNKTGLDFVII